MRYIQVTGTDLKPSSIVMGGICAVEGPPDEPFQLLDQYREAGGRCV